jgi:ankyrin repeat protein
VDLPDSSAGSTPLILAASAGACDVARDLLNRGAHPDQPDRSGSTPLHHAARTGATEIMRLLLASGALVHVRNQVGPQSHNTHRQGHV